MVMIVGGRESRDEMAILKWVLSHQVDANERYKVCRVWEIRTEKSMRIIIHKLHHVSSELSELINSLCSSDCNIHSNRPRSAGVSCSNLRISFPQFCRIPIQIIPMCWSVTRRRIIKGKDNDHMSHIVRRASQLKVVDNSAGIADKAWFSDHSPDHGTTRSTEKDIQGWLKHEIQELWLNGDLLILVL
jgi:hypothetical protein